MREHCPHGASRDEGCPICEEVEAEERAWADEVIGYRQALISDYPHVDGLF